MLILVKLVLWGMLIGAIYNATDRIVNSLAGIKVTCDYKVST